MAREQQAAASGAHSAAGPACPNPMDSSAEQGQHTQSSGGCSGPSHSLLTF